MTPDPLGRLARLLVLPTGTWWVLLGAAVAVYGCVPETSNQMPRVFLLLGAGLVTEAVVRRPLPWPFRYAGWALVLWAGMYGATGRASAIAGTAFAVALVAWLPVATIAWPSLERVGIGWRWVVAGAAAVASVGMARTGGIARTLPPALLAAAAWLVALTLVTAALARVTRP